MEEYVISCGNLLQVYISGSNGISILNLNLVEGLVKRVFNDKSDISFSFKVMKIDIL